MAPRLIDAGKFLKRLKPTLEIRTGDIRVPDMIVTVLLNYDENILKSFLDPDPKSESIAFFRAGGSGGDYFYIEKYGSRINERLIQYLYQMCILTFDSSASRMTRVLEVGCIVFKEPAGGYQFKFQL